MILTYYRIRVFKIITIQLWRFAMREGDNWIKKKFKSWLNLIFIYILYE